MKIFLTGGGTGGHFYPLIAVAEALRAHVPNPAELSLGYVGPDPFDKGELDRLDIAFIACPAGKVRRYVSFLNIIDVFKLFIGVLVACAKLYRAYPDVVLSKGGYTAVPVLIAARILGIPVVIHESDAKMGRANALAVSFARYIAVSYPNMAEGLPKDKTALTGIPMRASLRSADDITAAAYAAFGITDTQTPVVAILGGSLGAERVNLMVLDALDTLLPSYTVIHQTGRAHEAVVAETAKTLIADPRLTPRYVMRGYLSGDEMHKALSIASVVISRAGSGSIAEIAQHGKPSILIPIPEEISHDQRTNAYAYADTGAAYVLEEANIREHIIASLLDEILNNATTYIAMSDAARAFAKPDAAEKIARALVAIARSHG